MRSTAPSEILSAADDAADDAPEVRPAARLGVLSDTHIRDEKDGVALRKAFDCFRRQRVDGVVIAGDITDNGRLSELKIVSDAWFSVFPEGRGEDGKPVEQLFIYGNHDYWGWCWTGDNGRRRTESFSSEHPGDAIGVDARSRAEAWRTNFREEYRDVWVKRVGGIPVIGVHWNNDLHVLEDFLAANPDAVDPSRPFFYVQHPHLKDTCFGSWSWGADDGETTRALSGYPNAIAISGHSHYALTDERSIWQGAFTSINAGSFKYASLDYPLRENALPVYYGPGYDGETRVHSMDRLDTSNTRHGMIIDVFPGRLAVRRLDFASDSQIGDIWNAPLPSVEGGPMDYAVRARSRSKPAFPSGASVIVVPAADKDGRKRLSVRFPPARPVDGCRVFEYEVTATLKEDGVDLVQAQRRFLAPDFHLAACRADESVDCALFLDELPIRGHYVFSARPIECFGNKGEEIASEEVDICRF